MNGKREENTRENLHKKYCNSRHVHSVDDDDDANDDQGKYLFIFTWYFSAFALFLASKNEMTKVLVINRGKYPNKLPENIDFHKTPIVNYKYGSICFLIKAYWKGDLPFGIGCPSIRSNVCHPEYIEQICQSKQQNIGNISLLELLVDAVGLIVSLLHLIQ